MRYAPPAPPPPVAPPETGIEGAFERMETAAAHADRIDAAWRESALAQVRAHASEHALFLAERVGIVVPEGADTRCIGAVMREAKRLGWVEKMGMDYGHCGSSKTLWRSLICAPPDAFSASQLVAVRELMKDGMWRTLPHVARLVGCSEERASACLKALRKIEHGSYGVDQRATKSGSPEFRVLAP